MFRFSLEFGFNLGLGFSLGFCFSNRFRLNFGLCLNNRFRLNFGFCLSNRLSSYLGFCFVYRLGFVREFGAVKEVGVVGLVRVKKHRIDQLVLCFLCILSRGSFFLSFFRFGRSFLLRLFFRRHFLCRSFLYGQRFFFNIRLYGVAVVNRFRRCKNQLSGGVELLFASCLRYRLKLVKVIYGLFNLGVVLVKIDVVPYEEYIYRPYAAAVVLLAAEMLVKPRYKRVGVEELLSGLALELFLYHIVVFLVAEPYSCGNGETELFLFGGFLGQMPCRCLAHCVFCVALVYSQLGGDR